MSNADWEIVLAHLQAYSEAKLKAAREKRRQKRLETKSRCNAIIREFLADKVQKAEPMYRMPDSRESCILAQQHIALEEKPDFKESIISVPQESIVMIDAMQQLDDLLDDGLSYIKMKPEIKMEASDKSWIAFEKYHDTFNSLPLEIPEI